MLVDHPPTTKYMKVYENKSFTWLQSRRCRVHMPKSISSVLPSVNAPYVRHVCIMMTHNHMVVFLPYPCRIRVVEALHEYMYDTKIGNCVLVGSRL